MERGWAVTLCLGFLVLSSGCAGFLSDPGSTEGPSTSTTTERTEDPFELSLTVNRSVADGIGFDFQVTNIRGTDETARLVAVAEASNGTEYQLVRTFAVPAGESRNVTVVFEAFESYTGPTVSADVTVVEEDS